MYRLVHEGSLHVLQQPLASVNIKYPGEEAKIPAGHVIRKPFESVIIGSNTRNRRTYRMSSGGEVPVIQPYE